LRATRSRDRPLSEHTDRSLSEPAPRSLSEHTDRSLSERSESKGLTDEPHTPEILESTLAWRGRVWDVRDERFRYLDGELTRHYLDHPGAVAVLALDDDDRIRLIQQYRHPVRLREWELPAGLMDVDGEPALLGAQRELAEEVDLTADEWHLLADIANSPGGSNEVIRVYLARGLHATDASFERTAEEADMVVCWVPLDEAVEAVRAGRVQNAIAVIAILAAWFERERGWSGLRDPHEPWTRHPRLGTTGTP
jgi:8-oxo-dGTP pyrophosphatase MutT (NUDIX family)